MIGAGPEWPTIPEWECGRDFLQIGAGAGDLDPRFNFRDGFSEQVKSLDRRLIDNIVLVEPNPVNIAKLEECWANDPQAAVFQMGVVPDNIDENSMVFYWAPEDGPQYLV